MQNICCDAQYNIGDFLFYIHTHPERLSIAVSRSLTLSLSIRFIIAKVCSNFFMKA